MSQTSNLTHIEELFNLPFNELLFQAQSTHRKHFDPNSVQTCNLLSIKTGACPEDCSYCAQSIRNRGVKLEREKLLDCDQVLTAAKRAKTNGATRFCMGAAWRSPPTATQFNKVLEMCKSVKSLNLETCMTLGMVSVEQAQALKEAGLDYYNHNLDTSPEFYEKIITTRTYQDRLDTLELIDKAGLKTCCGGIMGMGEKRSDRIEFINQLLLLETPPKSIPINQLVPIQGTPLANTSPIEPIEFIKTIAVTRILFPTSFVRLAAGRESMSGTMQALCYFSGANSIFVGDKLLTTDNNKADKDTALFNQLGIHAMTQQELANA